MLSARSGQALYSVVQLVRRLAKLGWMPAVRWAVVLSVYAALLHDWVIPDHYWEWWGYGAYFVAAGAAQAFLAGLLLLWPGRPVFLVGIVGNCAMLILYAVTRTVGIPVFGPDAGRVEPVGSLDLVTAAAEIGLVVVLARQVRASDRSNSNARVEVFQTRRAEAERPRRGVVAAAAGAARPEPG